MTVQQFIAKYDQAFYGNDLSEEQFTALVDQVYAEMQVLGFDFEQECEIEMALGF